METVIRDGKHEKLLYIPIYSSFIQVDCGVGYTCAGIIDNSKVALLLATNSMYSNARLCAVSTNPIGPMFPSCTSASVVLIGPSQRRDIATMCMN